MRLARNHRREGEREPATSTRSLPKLLLISRIAAEFPPRLVLCSLEHLLKLQFSPAIEPRAGWIETIGRERRDIEDLLADSPSLRNELESLLAFALQRTAAFVADILVRRGEAGEEVRPQIEQAGYTAEQVLGDWLPESFACR